MSKHFTRLAIVLFLTLGLTPLYGVANNADVSDVSKNESPSAALTSLLSALASGDVDKVKTCFDTSEENGKNAAEAFQEVARLGGAQKQLVEAAKKKFGEAGQKAVEKNLGLSEPKPVESIPNLVKKDFEIVQEENTATATSKNSKDKEAKVWRFVRKGDHWYVSPSKEETAAMSLVAGITRDKVKLYRTAEEALKRSTTVEQFSAELLKLNPTGSGQPGNSKLPEIGKQLAHEPGVSMVRVAHVEKKQKVGPLPVTSETGGSALGDRNYSGTAVSLQDALLSVAAVPRTRLFLPTALPGGKYDIHVEAKGPQELFDKLSRVYEQNFDLHIAKEKRELPALVLMYTKGDHAKSLPKATSVEKQSSRSSSTSIEYTGKASGLAQIIERFLKQIVVDESGIEGTTTLSCQCREDHRLEDLNQYLEQYGLTLKQEKRNVESVFVEAKKQ